MTDVVEIPLTQGYVALIDAADYPLVAQYKWQASRNSNDPNRVYARAAWRSGGKWHQVKMHRLIMGAEAGVLIDHRDGDTLNNRRYNLREASHAQNSQNKTKAKKAEGYKGYSYNKKKLSYSVRIRVNGRLIYGGSYSTPLDAAKRYDELAREHHGEFAKLNFPMVDVCA